MVDTHTSEGGPTPPESRLQDFFPVPPGMVEALVTSLERMRDSNSLQESVVRDLLAGTLVSYTAKDEKRIDVLHELIHRMVQGMVGLHLAMGGKLVDGMAPADRPPEAEIPKLFQVVSRERPGAWFRLLASGGLEHGPDFTPDEAAQTFFAMLAERIRTSPPLLLAVLKDDGQVVVHEEALRVLQLAGWTVMRAEERMKLAGVTPGF